MYFKFMEFEVWIFEYEITQDYVLHMMIKNRLRAMDFSRTQLGRMCWVLINPRADQIESTFMYILYTILIKKMWSYSGVAVSLGQAQIL